MRQQLPRRGLYLRMQWMCLSLTNEPGKQLFPRLLKFKYTMSLYTFTTNKKLPALPHADGLHIEESADINLLAAISGATQAEITSRFANDHVAFVAFMKGEIAAFGWMARGKALIGELNHEFIVPESNRYLWNFRTFPAFRGLGIYPALLQYIIQFESSRAGHYWIIHAPENRASESGILRAGFEYVGKLFVQEDGSVGLIGADTKDHSELLSYMSFLPSEGPGANCWNCSSPYLKKRQPECCCKASRKECSGQMLAVA